MRDNTPAVPAAQPGPNGSPNIAVADRPASPRTAG